MNQKPLPPDNDVKELAKRLRKLRVPGQGVRPYLRKHATLFRQLRRDDWSWAGLALAMTKAGIMYQTEKPWTAETLLQAFARAQVPLKSHTRRNSDQMAPEVPVARSGTTSPPTLVSSPSEVGYRAGDIASAQPATPVPRFKPVSIRPVESRARPSQEELAEIERNRILTFGRP